MNTVEEILTSGDYDGHGSVAELAQALKNLARDFIWSPAYLAKWYNEIALIKGEIHFQEDDKLGNALVALSKQYKGP